MPKPFLFFIIIILGCAEQESKKQEENITVQQPSVTIVDRIDKIPLPPEYNRVSTKAGTFGSWLHQLKLKKDKTVYLYNGLEKPNQDAQYAVLELERSKTDIQQCADVVMRLRAEYLFANHKYDSIRFMDFNNKWYSWNGKDNRYKFDNYLLQVFGWCGSASLEKQLRYRKFEDMQPGDVLIKGGFPGHAMIIADMAINRKGEKIFLLVQGYQPAQDIHVVVNPTDPDLSPWYKFPTSNEIHTPEWLFNKNQLHSWQ